MRWKLHRKKSKPRDSRPSMEELQRIYWTTLREYREARRRGKAA